MEKNTLKWTAIFATIFATIIIIFFAVVLSWCYSERKRAHEEFNKAMEEDRKYFNEQQQEEEEERLEMKYLIIPIDAQGGE
ncbi:MAG: hypothetical protein SO294_00530 [Prevotella sp.]|nr:hypothetical protein [Prevotella sp.]